MTEIIKNAEKNIYKIRILNATMVYIKYYNKVTIIVKLLELGMQSLGRLRIYTKFSNIF